MKSALFVSYYYPPGFRVGYERVVKFRKFLPEFGYRTSVLGTRLLGTADTDASDKTYRATEPALLYRGLIRKLLGRRDAPTTGADAAKSLSEGTRAQGMRDWLLEWVFIPDLHVLWMPFAIWRGLSVIRREKIDVIVSSSGPETNHLVGLALSMISGRPLVADFRDGWLFEPLKGFLRTNRIRRAIERALERRVARRAAAVVTVSDPITDYFRDTYRIDRAYTLTNGFDGEDWQTVVPAPRSDDRFRLVSTGSFAQSRVTSSPRPFFEAIAVLPVDVRKRLEVVLVGSLLGEEEKLIAEMKLDDTIRRVPPVPRHESLGYQMSADALLLVTGTDLSVATSKLYEYLRSGRPILAVAPAESAAGKIVASTGAGIVVDPGDVAGITKTLEELIRRPRAAAATPNVEAFDRRAIARRLAGIMDDILERRSAA